MAEIEVMKVGHKMQWRVLFEPKFIGRTPVVSPMNNEEILIMKDSTAQIFNINKETTQTIIDDIQPKIQSFGPVYLTKKGEIMALVYESRDTHIAKLVKLSLFDS